METKPSVTLSLEVHEAQEVAEALGILAHPLYKKAIERTIKRVQRINYERGYPHEEQVTYTVSNQTAQGLIEYFAAQSMQPEVPEDTRNVFMRLGTIIEIQSLPEYRPYP